LCSSGNEELTSGEVTQLGYGVIKVAARRAAAISIVRACLSTTSADTVGRNRFGRNLVNLGDHDIADQMRERVLEGAAFRSNQVSRRRSQDDVDFSGREALQRFRVIAGIRHARRS
jgi:hypothetical protein